MCPEYKGGVLVFFVCVYFLFQLYVSIIDIKL